MNQQGTRKAPITIIIPARNRAGIITRTLASVRAQSFRPLNVILVDNDSTDNTLEVMRQWASQVSAEDISCRVITEKRHGATSARNAGAELADTPWIMFFDSDDEMAPNHIADIVSATTANPAADIIGRAPRLVTLGGKTIAQRFTARHPLFNHIFHSILATQRYAMRLSLYRAAGPWDTRAWGWDDWELGLRLLLRTPRIIDLGTPPTVTQHAQADSITGTDFSSSPAKWENTIDLCEADIIAAGRPQLKTWLDVRRVTLASAYRREGSLTAARKLLQKTLRNSSSPRRLRLIYILHRLLNRGSAQMARILFPLTPRN